MGFLDLNILDLIDILLVTVLLYQLYKLVKGTVAIKIFIGIAAVYLVWKLVEALQMDLLSEILGQFIGVGVLAVIIVFQQEIRKFLLMIGTTSFGNQQQLFKGLLGSQKKIQLDIDALIDACVNMAAVKTGAIIVITRNTELASYARTGEAINAKVSTILLESIFYKNSPLHDGAVIINRDMITAARCVLQITDTINVPIHMGLRHRAAASITEMTDALTIVVSEQTGRISYFKQGRLSENISPQKLSDFLIRDLKSR